MRFGERVFETTDTTGTGSYALNGAATGHQTFLAGIGAGDLVGYIVTDGTNWEVGFGTLSSGPATLTRAGIIDSSNSGAAVNWGAGTKNIYSAPIAAVLTSLVKTHKGSAAPAWLPAGALWVDDGATPWLLKIKKSSGSVTLGRVDATNGRAIFEGSQGTDIASASSIDIGAATGDLVHITGTTTITALGTADAGVERTLVFDGILTLTHNATSLILLGGANITTAAGDVVRMRSEGSGNWRQVGGWRANGKAWVAIGSSDLPAATVTAQGAVVLTTKALQEGASGDTAVTPGTQHHHPLHPKAWGNLDGTGTIALRAGAGISSVTDLGTGSYRFNWATAFSGNDLYAVTVGVQDSTTLRTVHSISNLLAASATINVGRTDTQASTDTNLLCVDAYGPL